MIIKEVESVIYRFKPAKLSLTIKNRQKLVNTMTNNANDHVMTLEELAIYLKVPKSTMYKLVQEGRIPGQKIGKQWRFARVAIDRWLDTEIKQNGE